MKGWHIKMANITALRFSPTMGAIAIDQESWYLRNRKTFFTDFLYKLLPKELEAEGLQLIYGGIGHPSFHHEVVAAAKKELEMFYSTDTGREQLSQDARPIFSLSRIILKCFQNRIKKRIDDRLSFLFGFDTAEFAAETFNGEISEIGDEKIKQKTVIERTLNVINGKEDMGYGRLTVPNEACLIGIDPKNGFCGFTIKESDGVLSYHSCGFEALGPAKYIAGAEIGKVLNSLTLDDRRAGMGFINGMITLGKVHVSTSNSFGQVGGNVRIGILDGSAKKSSELYRELDGKRAQLLTEIIRANNALLLDDQTTKTLVERIFSDVPFREIERTLFLSTSDFVKLDKLLRGYKVASSDFPQINHLSKHYKTIEPILEQEVE